VFLSVEVPRITEALPMTKSELPPEWYQTYADWGRELLRKFPKGIGPEPDFSQDGTARTVWSTDGFIVQQRAFWTIGEFHNVHVGDRIYAEYPKSTEDQIHIADTMFVLAGASWAEAKAEADRKAERDREIAQVAEEHARVAEEHKAEIRRLTEEVSAADTVNELEVRAEDLRDRLEAIRRDETKEDPNFLREELLIVNRRMIELERETAKSNWRWAVGGFVVGVIGVIVGVAFPLWDLAHCPTISVAPAPQGAKPS
jgi:hypothetical protein